VITRRAPRTASASVIVVSSRSDAQYRIRARCLDLHPDPLEQSHGRPASCGTMPSTRQVRNSATFMRPSGHVSDF